MLTDDCHDAELPIQALKELSHRSEVLKCCCATLTSQEGHLGMNGHHDQLRGRNPLFRDYLVVNAVL